ncbi:MAG: 4-hydroxy-tetrahydrodipicolinate reductase [Armatimonadetes bacterium]|nr:4-hydroxy-tetrahydrodipicolinate reductase [Armatimonadota bacterium]MDW8120788.1 4-hydroxy-tetrahydrodipicolinate reductase [Armatimonadota bacterium]
MGQQETSFPVRVAVCGCCGRMGSEVSKALLKRQDLQLVAGIDIKEQGRDIGEVLVGQSANALIYDRIEEAVAAASPQVVVDFTHPSVVVENVKTCLRLKVSPVVGTTGWTEEKVREVDALAKEQGVPMVIAPNFAIGAVLMMKFAVEASRYFDRIEIIELHHDGKVDAPSGTALRTAELIHKGRNRAIAPPKVSHPEVLLDGALGGDFQGIRIHSIRLPGLVAHQEVLLGMPGQVLTIRHDALSREAFVPGVLLAIEKVLHLPPGVTFGLENLL